MFIKLGNISVSITNHKPKTVLVHKKTETIVMAIKDWENHNMEQLFVAYNELQNRNYTFTPELNQKVNEFLYFYNAPSIEDFNNIFLSFTKFANYEEYVLENNANYKKRNGKS